MLTGKQRAYLRKLANSLDTIFQIGKGGLGENIVSELNKALEARELIKIHLLETSFLDTKQTCNELARLTAAEPVAAIGSKIVLYKESENNKTIELPKK